MDKQILFLVIGAVIWIFQIIIKSRSKAAKQVNTMLVKTQPSSIEDHSQFDEVLNEFSNKLKRDLDLQILSQDTQLNKVVSEANTSAALSVPVSKSKVPLVRSRERGAPNLRSLKTLKGAVIAAEILKTKF